MNATKLALELAQHALDDRHPRQVCADEDAEVLIVRTESMRVTQLMFDGEETFHVPRRVWDACQGLSYTVEDYGDGKAVVFS